MNRLFTGNKLLYITLKLNYYASVLLFIGIIISTILGQDILFKLNTEIYGPLTNNLRIMLVYLAFMEIAITSYCFYKNQYLEIIMLGIFFMTMSEGIKYYSGINEISLKPTYYLFFIYVGASHVCFGIFDKIHRDN